MRCSSCQRSAPDSPRSRRSSSACASSSCARARASSTSAARTASSTSAIARSSSTLKKPGPVAYSRTSSPVWTRVEPAFSVATSGACRARTPISPAAPGTTIISASPSKAGPSGVTRETSKRRLGSLRLLFALLWLLLLAAAAEPLRLLDGLLDRADHVEGLLGQLVVLAVEDLREALDRVLELHVLAGRAGELLGDEVRLREEALDLPRAGDDEPVLVGELVDAEDGDDVLEVLVALEHLLDAGRRPVVVVGDDPRLEGARERVERVHRRVDALLHDRAREHRRRVEVGEGIGRRRVGEIVGRHVDRLHRGDRALVRRGDALLELAHLGRERGLVPDGARHAAEERRDLGARLHEAEDVVDEEEDVLALVAEVLRHRQAGETDAEARARRLVHLPVAERDLVDHLSAACSSLSLGHLEPEIVALAGPLADAREDRDAAVLAGEIRDQLLDQHRLADAGAA